MSLSRSAILIFSIFISGVFSTSTFAGIINPSFEQGFDSWVDLSSNGSVTVESGAAILAAGEGEDLFSAVLAQGDDGTFLFEKPIEISPFAVSFKFDLWMVSRDEDVLESGNSLFQDSLTLAFYDQEDLLFDLIFPSLSFGSTPSFLLLDISSLAGRNVSLSFELTDENDGFNLALGLDNLAIIEKPAVSVPESNGAVLLLIGLFSLVLMRRSL